MPECGMVQKNGRRASIQAGFTMRALLVLATACQVAGFATMPGGMGGSTNGCYGAGHSVTCEKDGATEATCPAGAMGQGWQTKWTACGEPEAPTPSMAQTPTPGATSVAACVAGLPDPRARPQPSPPLAPPPSPSTSAPTLPTHLHPLPGAGCYAMLPGAHRCDCPGDVDGDGAYADITEATCVGGMFAGGLWQATGCDSCTCS